MTPLERAIDIAGGQAAMARKLTASGYKVRQAHIWKWLNHAKKLPAEAVLPIEAAVDGAVTRFELRPDIYPPAERAA